MKTKILGLCAALLVAAPLAAQSVTDTYSFTGTEQSFVVPAGVSSVTIEAWGAQGGFSVGDPRTDNLGGYATGTLAVSPGDTLYIYVGEQPTGIAAGFNGGGAGESGGAGGGGASDVRLGGNALSDRVIVAGGGGGGGLWTGQEVIGGVGGGLTGGDGYRTDPATAPGGGGGGQSASSNGTCMSLDNPVVAGGFGVGGSPLGQSCGCEGYGGGGGWYGGAGSGNCRGGGGGSSYIDGLVGGVTTAGLRLGNGEVQITYEATAAEAVPALPLWALAALSALLVLGGYMRLYRPGRGQG